MNRPIPLFSTPILHTMKPAIIFSFFFLLFTATTTSAYTFTAYLNLNFSGSYRQFIDNSGTFLFSPNRTFKAAIFNPVPQQTTFYLSVLHVASTTVIWSANRNSPITDSGKVNLTAKGITVSEIDGTTKWSTPPLRSPVYRLLLTEMGNLVLIDRSNASLWESFDYPTDTIVIGQRLAVGSSLSTATGSYNLTVTDSDAVLRWYGQIYWKLSMDTSAYKNSNDAVKYMEVNRTSFFLFGSGNGAVPVFQVSLPEADFRIAKLDSSGQFVISSFSGNNWKQEFAGPDDGCRTPLACGRVGLCNDDASSSSSSPVCSCPQNFRTGNSGGCVPSNGSYSLPLGCSDSNSSIVSFLKIGNGVDYFRNIYSDPVMNGVNISVCQKLCSGNCSCLGIFYKNSSGSCYVIENELGSVLSSNGGSNKDMFSFIKVESTTTNGDDGNGVEASGEDEFPVAAAALLPIAGFILVLVIAFLLWRRAKLSKKEKNVKLGKQKSTNSSMDRDAFYIPGLPRRFDYEELDKATENFKTLIGSGGFGAVYKGVLSDKTVVAVKKIINIGVQGKKDFCTEIAVIGNIHHVNLVKLKGFCAQGRHRMLVYEYMNRGSLDRTLFGAGPAMEWEERFHVALGTARGLAYLHTGCEHKIIHCDIKPENILLQDQFHAKISDFGLSKLLSPEESGLFTTMRGTRGYLAPEWLTNSAITEKTDVYSFGMVLLELVSGRKNCYFRSKSHSVDRGDSNSGGRNNSTASSSTTGLIYFPLFALEMHEQGSYMELADQRMEGRVRSEDVEKIVKIALCCVHEEPALRPNMVAVVGMLEGGTQLPEPRMESLNFLRFYGRRFTEASMIGEGNEEGGSMVHYQDARNSTSMTTSGSQAGFSYMSSHSVSGPR